MSKTFRRGAVGAMMDEYERAAAELLDVIAPLSDEAFEAIRDTETEDEMCRSIQTVMQHVIRSGYGYANYFRTAFGMEPGAPESTPPRQVEVAPRMAAMLAYTEATLEGRWLMTDDEMTAVRMEVRWGPVYDFEQLFEHAIVHVLRHRRQIQRFLTEPQFAPK